MPRQRQLRPQPCVLEENLVLMEPVLRVRV